MARCFVVGEILAGRGRSILRPRALNLPAYTRHFLALGPLVDRRLSDMSHRFTLPFSDITLADIPIVGGKAASLGEMTRELVGLGVAVPPGFAVTSHAYDAVLDQGTVRDALHELIAGVDVDDVGDLATRAHRARACVVDAGLPATVRDAVQSAYASLEAEYGHGVAVAVRSSATAEDLPDASFAGQQATMLNVRGASEVVRATLLCFASLFTDRAVAYREHHGFDHFAVRGAVAIQLMVRADQGSAGVMFTVDPETGFEDVIVVSGAWGLGESVVAGRVDPDEMLVFKSTLDSAADPIIRRRLGAKQTRIVYASRGAETIRTESVSQADRDRFCFDDDDAKKLARWGLAIEAHYTRRAGRATPMDIEWAKDGFTGELFIVQARPETVHSQRDRSGFDRFHVEVDAAPRLSGIAIGQGVGHGRVAVVQGVHELASVEPGAVLVADMTDPDWVPVMRRASAIVTNRGGRTCHAAIVSRELGVPCIVGTSTATRDLAPGDMVTVSCAQGAAGHVYAGELPVRRERVELDALPKVRTKLMLNLADPDQAFTHACLPAAGVGLVRQEFIIANHVGLHPLAAMHAKRLDEATQASIAELTRGYAHPTIYYVRRLAEGIGQIAAAFYPRPVIVRLSDFKSNEYARLPGGSTFEPREENPMIGFRGASRYVHERYRDAFALECRAMAHVRGAMGLTNVKLMVPFCRTPDEGRAVVAAMAEHGLERGRDGLEIWVMCEIPSNVVLVDRFAEVFDGFSIGSNDLTQLVLGVDRDSELLAATFSERDEAVMRTISAAIRGAHQYGRPIGLCGQAPSDDPEFARFLVNEGIDSISLGPDALVPALHVVAAAEAASARC